MPRAKKTASTTDLPTDDLEGAILRAPDDPAPYLVYADWLRERGDPRGELIAVQHARTSAPDDPALAARERELLAEHGRAWLGPIVGRPKAFVVQWHLGFVRSVRVKYSDTPQSTGEPFAAFVDLPAARLLREVVFEDRPADGARPIADALAKATRPALERFVCVDFDPEAHHVDTAMLTVGDVGSIGNLWRAAPNLREVIITANDVGLGRIALPSARRFDLRLGYVSSRVIRALAAAKWPRLERLHIWFGARDGYDYEDREPQGRGAPGELDFILSGAGLPELRDLGLVSCMHADALCAALPKSAILPRLRALDLSKGTMTDAGARAIVANRAAYAHLERLDVSRNRLTRKGAASLRGVCADVRVDDQDDARTDRPLPRYHACVE